MEVFRGKAIFNNATGDVLIEHTDPLPKIWYEVEWFKALFFTNPQLNESKDYSKYKKNSYTLYNFLILVKGHCVCSYSITVV